MTNELKEGPPPLSPGFRIVFGVFLVAAFLLVWIPKFLPLTDYPEHLLAIQILAHFHDPRYHYARDYTVQLGNVPYVFIYLVGRLLNRFLSVFTVGKILLSFYVLLTPLSLLAYIRSIRNVSPWSSLLSFAFLFNLFYYLGSLNFLISIPLSFLVLALILKLLNPPAQIENGQNPQISFFRQSWRPAALMLVSTALFYTHIVSYAAVILAVAGLCIAARLRRRPIMLAAAPVVPSVLLAGFSVYKELTAPASALGASWLPFSSRLFDLLQPFLIYRDDYFHRIVIDRLGLPLASLAALWLVTGLLSYLTMRNRVGLDAWLVFFLLLLAALVFPTQIPSASFAHRLSILVLLSVCGVLSKQFGEHLLTKVLLVTLTVFALTVTAWRASEFNREMKPFLNAMARMQPDARVLPLIQNLHSAHLKTYCFLHITNYYHLEKQGGNPYLLFRNMPQIPVHYRFLDQLPHVGSFEPDLFDWDTHHDHYRYFLTRDASARVMDQLQSHSRLIYESQGWGLFEAQE
ncbi:MAG: hypothetical protein LAO31_00965 [Acidobacteriia bacterium]|nr:hypothetical protein [Terriglobia bacterium]